MSRRSTSRLLSFCLSVTGATLLAFTAIGHPGEALAACSSAQHTSTGTYCGDGNICQSSNVCAAFAITLSAPIAEANTFSVRINQNAEVPATYQAHTCLDSNTVCGTPVIRPALWTSRGNLTGNQVLTTSGLTPGRAYTQQTAGVLQSSASVQPSTFKTIPGFRPASVTVSNILATTATVNWTTDTPGTSRVWYSESPPAWVNTGPTLAAGDTVNTIGDSSTRRAWVGTQFGKIYHWDGSGWNQVYSDPSGRPILEIDTSNPSLMVAVGMNGAGGTLVVTSSNGVAWSALATIPEIDTFMATVSVVSGNEFWMGGSGEKIFRYKNGVWTNKTPPGARADQTVISIASNNGVQVWAGDTLGKIWRTADSGTNWVSDTPPGAGGSYIFSLSTVDGQSVWAGGGNGQIWVYKTATGSWNSQTTNTSATITDLYATRPDQALFVAGSRVGNIKENQPASFDDTLAAYEIKEISAMTPAAIFVSGDTTIYKFGLDTPRVAEDLANTTNHSVTLDPLNSNQRHYVAVESWNSGYGTGAFGEFMTLPIDTTPPTITVTNPAGLRAYTRNNSYIISGTISDNLALQSLRCTDLTDHVEVSPAVITITPNLPYSNAGAPVSATWQADVWLGLIDITREFECRVWDGTLGATTPNIRISRDRTPPNVNVTHPDPFAETPLSGLPVMLEGDTSDSSGFDHMDFQLNGAAPVVFAAPAGTSGTFNTDIGRPRSGENILDVHAYDKAGNVGLGGVLFQWLSPSFDLSIDPAAMVTTDIGPAVTYTVTATSKNGFSDAVSLSVAGAPVAGASFAPASVTPPDGGTATSTLTVPTAGASAGTYDLTITGTAPGSLTDTVNVTLKLRTPPDFTLSVAPNLPLPDLIAGENGSYSVVVSANSSFDGDITFSAAGAPTGVTLTYQPSATVHLNPSESNSSTTLDVTTLPTTAEGSYRLTITARSGTITKTAIVDLNITAAPDFDIAMDQVMQEVTAGGVATFFSGTVTSTGGFDGLVTLSLNTFDDPNLVVSAPVTITSRVRTGIPVNFIFNISAKSPAPARLYPLELVGTHDTTTHRLPLTLDVKADVLAPTISAISVSPDWNAVTIDWTTDEPTTGDVVITKPDGTTVGVGDGLCPGSPCRHSVTYTPLEPRTTYAFVINAYDTAPTRNTSQATTFADGTPLKFTTKAEPDLIDPAVTVTNPADSETPTVVVGSLDITGHASDNLSVVRVDAKLTNGGTVYELSYTCDGTTDCDYSINWATNESTPNGIYVIEVTAFDGGRTSPIVRRQVSLENNFTPPVITAGPTVKVADACDEADGECWAKITWWTDQLATSEIRYGVVVSCETLRGTCTYPHGPTYDDKSLGDRSKLYRLHEVTLHNLERKQIYHYEITSCNGNRKCVY